MLKRTRRGLRFAKQSAALVRAYPKLLIFPIAGRGIYFSIAILITVFLAVLHAHHIDTRQLSAGQLIGIYSVLLILLYLFNVMNSFFNSALAFNLKQCVQGEKLSLTKGLRYALPRLGWFFVWIFFFFTGGFILLVFFDQLKKLKWVQQFTSGIRWHFIAFLTIPTLTNHPELGLFAAMQKAGHLIHDFFGSSPIINYSTAIPTLLLRLVTLIPLILGLYLQNTNLIFFGFLLSLVSLVIISIAISALQVILENAVYHYIVTGKIMPYFVVEDLQKIFKE